MASSASSVGVRSPPGPDGSAAGSGSRAVGGGPDGLQVAARDAVVQEVRIQSADDAVAVAQAQIGPSPVNVPMAVASTSSPAQICLQARPVRGRHGQHHALLRLAEPDLPGPQAGVLERHPLQLHVRAQLRGHLADGRGEAAGAAVGDGRVEALVAGQQHGFQHLLLVDGVADLHGAAGDLRRSRGPSPCEEKVAPRRPSRPVRPPITTTRSPGLRARRVRAVGQDAQAAAEDQRVGRVAADRRGWRR